MALLVTNQDPSSVLEYNATTGAFVKVFASGSALGDPFGVLIGLDGNLLVSGGNSVKRYNRATGAFMDVFASTNVGGLSGMTIHGGTLYVTTAEGVQSFDAVSGVNTGQFVASPPPTGSFTVNPTDVKVNPANNRLYVLYQQANTVETFDLTTKASFGLLMPPGHLHKDDPASLLGPRAMAFGPDGNLYISSGVWEGQSGVKRYNPTTGAFIDLFANNGPHYAFGIAFGPDENVYVGIAMTTIPKSAVRRFKYPTGALMGFFVPPASGGLDTVFHLTFDPKKPIKTRPRDIRRVFIAKTKKKKKPWRGPKIPKGPKKKLKRKSPR
jgi:DNA-binding beta-propeller fold protein YncE